MGGPIPIYDKDGEIIEESLSDETTRRIHASFKEFLDEVSNYHSIAEDAFIEARSNSD